MYVGRILDKRPIPMAQFDPLAVARVAREHLGTIQDARRRRVLENFIEHAEAEATGNYDDLMASCSSTHQHYAIYGGSRFGAPQSFGELETHYRGLIESNLHLIHFETEKLAVDDDVVVVEGLVHQLYPGALLGPIFDIQIDDVDAVYLATKRTCVIFVFDSDGKGAGEHAYADGDLTADDLLKLEPEEVPEVFWTNPVAAPAQGARGS